MAGWGLYEGLSAEQTNQHLSEGSCPLFPGFHWPEAGPDSFFAFVHACEEVLTSEVLSSCMCPYGGSTYCTATNGPAQDFGRE